MGSLNNSAEGEHILHRRMVAVGVAAAAATPLVVGAALGAAGFTAAGVAAGSWAAGWQAAQGTIAAGSWFAAAQSAGAAGLGAAGATLGGFGAGMNRNRSCGYRSWLHDISMLWTFAELNAFSCACLGSSLCPIYVNFGW